MCALTTFMSQQPSVARNVITLMVKKTTRRPATHKNVPSTVQANGLTGLLVPPLVELLAQHPELSWSPKQPGMVGQAARLHTKWSKLYSAVACQLVR